MMIKLRPVAIKLAAIEIWPVIVLAGVSLLIPRFYIITISVAAFFWFVRKVATGHFTRRTPADISILILVLMGVISVLITATPDITLLQVWRLIVGIAIYFSIVNWTTTSSKLRFFTYVFIVAGVLIAFFGLISVNWNLDKIPLIPASIYKALPTLITDLSHRNVIAGSLVILLPLNISMLIFAWKDFTWLIRVGLCMSVIGVLLVIVLSQSRGALSAFTIAIFLLAILRWRRAWILAIPIILIIPLGIYSLGITRVLEFLATEETVQGVAGRVDIWSRAIFMVGDFPLTGIGMGSFGLVADKLYPFFLASPDTIPHAHNLYLQVAVDLGIPGLIAWCATITLLVVISWQVYKNAKITNVPWVAGLTAGLLVSMVALIVHGVVDSVVWGMVRTAPLVWGLWGLAVASWYIQHSPESGDQIEASSSPIR